MDVQGEGFDCRTNKINGDGEWSNVAAQKQWIENRLLPGAGKGAQRSFHKNQIQNAEELFILFSLKLHQTIDSNVRGNQSKTGNWGSGSAGDQGQRLLRQPAGVRRRMGKSRGQSCLQVGNNSCDHPYISYIE